MIVRAVAVALVGVLGLVAPGGGSAQAATLDVRGGILFGASGVVIGGRTYDVEFIDGSCAAIFDGCDSVSDFDFTDEASANAAAAALRDQVVIDTGSFSFASVAGLTNGCVGGVTCLVFIPREVFGNTVSSSVLFSFGGSQVIFDLASINIDDFSFQNDQVYAQFTQVPVPAALPLMLGGLGVLALVGRRRRDGGR